MYMYGRVELGKRCKWVVSFTLRLLYLQRKSHLYPLDRRLGRPQSRSEKNLLPLPRIEPQLSSL
jgi:hypothetical protein